MNQPNSGDLPPRVAALDLRNGRDWLQAAEAAYSKGDTQQAYAAAVIGTGFIGLAHTTSSLASMAEVSQVRSAILSMSDEPETTLAEAIDREKRAEAEARPHVVDLASLPFLGFTEDGHPMGGPVPDDVQAPALVARCGGPGACGACAREMTAAVLDHLGESAREADRG